MHHVGSLAYLQVDTSRAHNTVGYATSSFGRVHWLGFSPFFDDLLLAVADSGFTIWQAQGGELGHQPLFESRFTEVFYNTGCWSPTKPGECRWAPCPVPLRLAHELAFKLSVVNVLGHRPC